MHISPQQALDRLSATSAEFLPLFAHGTLSLEIYRPDNTDKQQPHDRDEVYVVIAGRGDFLNDGSLTSFGPGDFLFVKAGKQHRFFDFSEDFCTWVIFYGPKGGEMAQQENPKRLP